MSRLAISFVFMALVLGCSRIETPPQGGDPERALVAATELRDVAQRFAASREQNLAVPAVFDLKGLHLRLPVRCRWDLL